MTFRPRTFLTVWIVLVLAACGGGSSSSSNGMPPAPSSMVRVRFVEGAPVLDTLINGVPQSIGYAYLRVNGQTVSSQFDYGSITLVSQHGARDEVDVGAQHAWAIASVPSNRRP